MVGLDEGAWTLMSGPQPSTMVLDTTVGHLPTYLPIRVSNSAVCPAIHLGKAGGGCNASQVSGLPLSRAVCCIPSVLSQHEAEGLY